ncbi:MAG: tRNA pseudouridine(55) synthase TruB [Eubacterium sp.]|nr:tRNA pseudouridine(55) synthase TruB [Eubacterium sp.]
MINGIINVYKEAGFTSFDVVAKLRGILKQKKIGHTGTLDPDATGVLPVCLGSATKVCDLMTDKSKEYVATMLLGIETDTYDISGRVVNQNKVSVDEDKMRDILQEFVGKSMQIPPMYSALKVNGKKLYEYARAGIEIEREPRKIHIYDLEILNIELPEITFRVHCSKGTYIRSICHDAGRIAGCGGCMKSLVRTRVDCFNIEQAHTLEEIESMVKNGNVNDAVLEVDSVFEAYPKATVMDEHAKVLYNGNRLQPQWLNPQPMRPDKVRIYDEFGAFIGIYRYEESRKDFKPEKIFWRQD